MPTIGFAGLQGWQRMRPTPTEFGRQVRSAAWAAATRTSTLGVHRDRQVLAAVKSQHPTALDVFDPAAILALLREPAPGRCNWDAYREQEPAATPTDALRGLLGSMCTPCRIHFKAKQIAKREHALAAAGVLAAAGRRPDRPSATGTLWATAKPQSREPSYYQRTRR